MDKNNSTRDFAMVRCAEMFKTERTKRQNQKCAEKKKEERKISNIEDDEGRLSSNMCKEKL